jgi:D-inositol-3-phosphate glycosyltransferase
MMRGRHIVIVGPAHPLRGGLSTFNERFARELGRENKVTLCTFRLQYPNFLFPGQSQYSDDPKPDDLNIDIALNSVNPFNWIRQGLRYRKLKPDLIIFRYWMPFFGPCFGTFARIVQSNGHTKVVAITDNIHPHERRFFDKPFTAWFLGCLDGAVTMSRAVLQDLHDLKFSKLALYNPHPLYDNFGTAPERTEACQSLGLDPDYRYILFFGFIRAYKGLDLLLEAFARASFQNKKVKLLVAGEFYEDAQPYLDIIRKHGMEERVVLHTHFIPNQQVAAYFAACDLVAQTYKNATQSGVTQIAYHFEKPMLVTDVGGLAELVPDGKVGYVCPVEETAIRSALEDFFLKKEPESFQAGLREQKQLFSWARLHENIQEVSGIR